ncbi:MAG: Fic family protein, partial [Candidatus Berkelbacteria bacterium]|nr:Fic family protein [Candidatus Berkelbacteria bacterium]
MTTKPMRERLKALKKEFNLLRAGKDSLLVMLDEAEIPESVYNSNAIENSTLTLKETEKILLNQEVSRDVSVREVFEAKNLAQVLTFVRLKYREADLSQELILLLHKMLLNGINDQIAGRLRGPNEYVRVGTHVAPAPEQVERLVEQLLADYAADAETYFADQIAHFHLGFEHIHPFNDGNGRIGRVLINYQLAQNGFPPIIIRDKEKQLYYASFRENEGSPHRTKIMESVIALALCESLHKRIAYLTGATIVPLVDY